VGESLSLLPLISRLIAARPGLNILVTSGTVTSAELLARRLPGGVIHQYAPVDLPSAVGRFLDHWRPDLAVFVESEIWPNLLTGARKRGARTALLSARLSEASVRGWSRAPRATRLVLGGFDLVLAQDDEAADRLTRLSARDDGRLT
jgi:3-deoxy-D-manno-octulosonic-acid transferase